MSKDKKSKDEMGDRMKKYESSGTKQKLDPKYPVIARIDGRSFSKFTKGCVKPFDSRVSNAMRQTCAYLVEQTHAKIGYVQSDEISLVYEATENGSLIFDGKLHKMNSVFASMAGVKFYSVYGGDKLPSFDCRVWSVPNRTEAANAILWRAIDARKNSVSIACRTYNSAKSMHGKSRKEQVDMLKDKGINFDEYPEGDKFGVFYKRVTKPTYIEDEAWEKIPDAHKPKSRYPLRSVVERVYTPFFGDIKDRVSFIFEDNKLK